MIRFQFSLTRDAISIVPALRGAGRVLLFAQLESNFTHPSHSFGLAWHRGSPVRTPPEFILS